MIDLKEIYEKHQEGVDQVKSLVGDEKEILQNYCTMTAVALQQACREAQRPAVEAVINGLRMGIALGVRVSIVNGELRARE